MLRIGAKVVAEKGKMPYRLPVPHRFRIRERSASRVRFQHRAERDGETGLNDRVAIINDIRSLICIPEMIVGVAANIDRAAAVYRRRREHRSVPLTGPLPTLVYGERAPFSKPPTTIVVGQSSHSSSARGRLGSGPSAARPREGSSLFPEVFGSNDRR